MFRTISILVGNYKRVGGVEKHIIWPIVKNNDLTLWRIKRLSNAGVEFATYHRFDNYNCQYFTVKNHTKIIISRD